MYRYGWYLLGKRKRISERNKNAIKQAHDKGIEIVVTTGRLYNNAAYFSKLLGVDSPVIAANGAIVIDQKIMRLYMNVVFLKMSVLKY